jgi:hypothetical protein
MTYRELELFIEGQEENRKFIRSTLAWVQANLMNIHVPRGKPRIKPEQLLPRSDKNKKSASDEQIARQLEMETAIIGGASKDPRARMEQAKLRAKAKQEKEDWENFISTERGKRYLTILEEE